MPRMRLLLILACAAGLILVGGLVWRAGLMKSEEPSLVGGPFQLVDVNGQPVTEAVLKGKWSAVFFGFTYCPDVCPGTLQALAAASEQLGPKAKDLQIVFISVDPARDTPAQMKAYLSADNLPPTVVGLTGSPEQVAAAAKAYRAYYRKTGDGSDYSVDHSTAVYLMNPKGRFVKPIAYSTPPDEVARQIRDAMAGR